MAVKKTYFLFSLLFIIVVISCKKNTYLSEKEIDIKIDKLQRDAQKINTDSLFFFLNKIDNLFLSKKIINDSLQNLQHYLKGKYHQTLNEKDSAIYYYNKSINNTNVYVNKIEFKSYNSIIDLYFYDNDYTNALSVNNQLLSKLDTTKHFKYLGISYNTKTKIYNILKEHKKALKNNTKSLHYLKKFKNELALNSIKLIRSTTLYRLDKISEAKSIIKSLLKNKNLSNFNNYQIYAAYGLMLLKDKKYKKAKNNFLISLNNAKKVTENYKNIYLIDSYNNLAEFYLKTKNYTESQKYLDSAFSIGFNGVPNEFYKNSLNFRLQNLYATNKSIKPILSQLDTIFSENEKNYKSKMNIELLALKKAYKKEKNVLKQRQETNYKIKNLKKNLLVLILSFGVLVLSAIVGLFYFRKKKIKSERDVMLLKQQMQKAQLNPNFSENLIENLQNLFNTDITTAKNLKEQLDLSKNDINNNTKRIVLKTQESDYIVKENDIYYCKSDGSYTTIFTKSQKNIVVSKSLTKVKEMLSNDNFIKTHQSYLININYVTNITKDGYIILNNTTKIPISKRRKEIVKKIIFNL